MNKQTEQAKHKFVNSLSSLEDGFSFQPITTGATVPPSSMQRATSPSMSSSIKIREAVAWFVVALQTGALLALLMSGQVPSTTKASNLEARITPGSIINDKPLEYHDTNFHKATTTSQSKTPFYDPPTFYPPSAGLVSRVWHSNGSPAIHPDLQKGSCWCSDDDYCMCTPSLAIDMILTAGPNHVYLVQRRESGIMALMGGFNEVGETVEEACRRELKEEMNLEIPGQEINLFGVYSDPKRDRRKHSVSVVFQMEIPSHLTPTPGDDATSIQLVPLSDIENIPLFVDHRTILRDYVKIQNRNRLSKTRLNPSEVPPVPYTGDEESFKRSVCAPNRDE